MKAKYILIFLLFFIFNCFSLATPKDKNTPIKRDSVEKVTNSEGTEFWLCFQKNYQQSDTNQPVEKNDLMLELFITGDKDSKIDVEIEGINFYTRVHLKEGTVENIKIPFKAELIKDEIPEKLAIHIKSDNGIAVYGLNHRYQTTDTYTGLPVSALGKEYRAMCYGIAADLLSQFAIIATEDSTIVKITPSAPTQKYPFKVPYSINLKKGEVYQVTAMNDIFSKCDLTGSLIQSNKKIAVFSGHQCAYVPQNIIACNHLVEQATPISAWGKHYYIGKFKDRSRYTFRVLANEAKTKVFIDNKLVKTLESGEYFEGSSGSNLQITSDKPILVAQFSQGYRNGDSIGDPMMILISPTQQFMDHYRFATPINGSWKHYINVVAPTASIGAMRLDGNKLDTIKFEQLGISRYSIAFIEIPYGSHIITGREPFGMYSYGFGFGSDAFDAYGNMGGQSFIEIEAKKDDKPPMAEIKSISVPESKNNNQSKKKVENSETKIEDVVIVRDDRSDDSGIKSVKEISSENLLVSIPKIEEGSPQVVITISPIDKTQPGRLIFSALDAANNPSEWTVCYMYDKEVKRHSLALSEGTTSICQSILSDYIGVFGITAINYNFPDFSKSGNVESKNKFDDKTSFGGYFGFLYEKAIKQDLSASFRLSFINVAGSLFALNEQDSIRIDGKFQAYQDAKKLEIKSLFVNLGLTGKYLIDNNFYTYGGLSFTFPLNDKIDYTREILAPSDYEFKESNGGSNKIKSQSALKFGLLGGIGASIPIYQRFYGFGEVEYNLALSSILNDATWRNNRLELHFGVRYRI